MKHGYAACFTSMVSFTAGTAVERAHTAMSTPARH